MENQNESVMDTHQDRVDVYSKRVRAGKRTYFFDVKQTRANDYFITITESKKKFQEEGYIKHKIFLYKEDFNKFTSALNETVDYVKKELLPDYNFEEFDRNYNDNNQSNGGFRTEPSTEPSADSRTNTSTETKENVEVAEKVETVENTDLKWD